MKYFGPSNITIVANMKGNCNIKHGHLWLFAFKTTNGSYYYNHG
jgi:hypothetical protein